MSGTVTGSAGTLRAPRHSGFFARPSTSLGWLSFGLFAAMFVMVILNSTVVIPRWGLSLPYNWLIVADGLLGGVVGLVGVVRAHERSWMVWLAIALPLSLILAEVVMTGFGLG
jgi:hypothetical protein